METKMKPPSPAALQSHLGFWLRFVSNHVSGRFRALLEAEGCSVSEWVALRALFERRQASHTNLIRALGMTKGAVSKLATRLEAKGLARRRPAGRAAGTEARGQLLALTPRGAALVPRLAALADANEEHFFGHLPARERRALAAAFSALVAHHGLTAIPVD
jgi:DNA-binding MarR family transcriptional regulator